MITKRVLWVLIPIGIIITLTGVVGAQDRGPTPGFGRQRLEGSWLLTITVTNPEGLAPVRILATATPEGSIVGTGHNPFLSTGHGTWTRIANRRFAITVIYFRSNAAGEFLGTTKIRATVDMNNSFDHGTGQFRLDLLNPNGDLAGSITGTGVATPIKAERLS